MLKPPDKILNRIGVVIVPPHISPHIAYTLQKQKENVNYTVEKPGRQTIIKININDNGTSASSIF